VPLLLLFDRVCGEAGVLLSGLEGTDGFAKGVHGGKEEVTGSEKQAGGRSESEK
jgi:hypothetical protein